MRGYRSLPRCFARNLIILIPQVFVVEHTQYRLNVSMWRWTRYP
jgi:hypothetical protein